jgi:ankyrin repeat protein
VLHRAAAGGDGALVGLLLDKGAAIEGLTGPSRITWVTEANFGMAPPPVPPKTPLMLAAEAGQIDTMRVLMARGANAGFVAQDGQNLVLAAAGSGNPQALALALDTLGDANLADAKGNTALHRLAGGRDFAELGAMLAVLARHGAKADVPNARGQTASMMAAKSLNAVRAAFATAFGAAHN